MSRTETKGGLKRTTKHNTSNSSCVTSNSSCVVKEVTPQILSLGTKPFLIFTDSLFKVDAYF